MRPTAVGDDSLIKLTPFCDWFRGKIIENIHKYGGFPTTGYVGNEVNPEPSSSQDGAEGLTGVQWKNREILTSSQDLQIGCYKTDHRSSEVIGPELSRQHSREAQVINALQNYEKIPKGGENPLSTCRGDTLPSSDSSDLSSKFYTTPTFVGNTSPNHPMQEVHDSHNDSNSKDRECGNSDSSGSSSTVRASSSDSNKLYAPFTTQLSHNSVNEPDTEVDELASNGAVQGQNETTCGSKNEQFVFNTTSIGICNISGAGGNDSPCEESPSPTKHTGDRELPPGHGVEGVVKRTSREVRLEYPVQESGISCGSDIVVTVPSIPRRIGLVFGSDMYVCT